MFSRCITGFCLSLESPSAVSVGLCLSHSIFDKDAWLSDRKIKASWPIWGKPSVIYVDNASEFHSEALQRGCDAHGIRIEYRPVGQPHFGGIVERVIGTMMQLIHQLPGTTFSSIVERGDYPSEEKAALTLVELERWLTLAITDYYHQKIHRGTKDLCYRSIAVTKEEYRANGLAATIFQQMINQYPNAVFIGYITNEELHKKLSLDDMLQPNENNLPALKNINLKKVNVFYPEEIKKDINLVFS